MVSVFVTAGSDLGTGIEFIFYAVFYPEFRLLTLRQRRVAQHELAAPHPITSLHAQLPTCCGCPHCQADATQLAPWGWSRGLRRYRCKQCR